LIDNPILNSPFQSPTRHFALDDEGAPTGAIVEGRRISAYVVPVAAPRSPLVEGAYSTTSKMT